MVRLRVIPLLILTLKIINASKTIEVYSNQFVSKLYESRNLEELLSGIINHLIRLDKVNCITIVCDTTYLNVFSGQWFKRINSIPVVMVVVEEPEDLLSPNYDTLESIRQSRKDGCNLYVILIANAIQTSRFLMFGDRYCVHLNDFRYRLIDTRANFILLHDLRLLSPKLHYIWKRIINVVFIRYHKQYKMDKNTTSWYELSTVPFPSPIKGVLVPKRIQSWRTNSVFKPSFLFTDKTLDLKGHTINVVAFHHTPAVVKVQHPEGRSKLFSGMEMEIMQAFASVMNFKPKVYEPMNANVEQWGHKQLNGSFTGLLGEMVGGNADIALGNLHNTPYHLQLTDLSIPYISECLTFLTPESLSDNSWKILILPFKLYMWVAVLLVLMVSGLIFYLLAQFHKRIEDYNTSAKQIVEKVNENNLDIQINSKYKNTSFHKVENIHKKPQGLYLFEEFTNSVLYTYGMLLVISLPQLPPGWSIRLLTGWYWIYCVLVVTSYRASMTAILANPAPRVTIDTMDQLADNPIKCGGWGEQTKIFFRTSLDETGQKIGKKFESINNPIQAVNRVINGDLAYFENIFFLKYLMARQEVINKQKIEKSTQQQSNNTQIEDEEEGSGDRNLHIMRECAIHMPISIGLQKNSPLKLRVDKLLRRIVEAGLVEKWLNDVMVPIYSEITDEENIKAEMNLKKLYAGFVALGIGYGLSLLAFIGEIIHWRYIVLRDPKFDIYAQYEYYNKDKK